MMNLNGNCKTCGLPLIGDGYTMTLHCESLDIVGSSYEKDFGPVYCTPRLTEEQVSTDQYLQLLLEANPPATPTVKAALELYKKTQIALLGAILRTKYKQVATNFYEGWQREEEEYWEQAVDEHEQIFYKLTNEERTFLQEFENKIAILCRGENIQ